VEQLDGVVSILFTFKLNKAIVLMFIGYFVSWQMNVDDGPCLQKQLPKQFFVDSLV